jgi:hypothetical protein
VACAGRAKWIVRSSAGVQDAVLRRCRKAKIRIEEARFGEVRVGGGGRPAGGGAQHAGWLARAIADDLDAAERATLRESVELLRRLADG